MRLYKLLFLFFFLLQSCSHKVQSRTKEEFKTIISWNDSIQGIPKRVFVSEIKNDNQNGTYLRYYDDGTLYSETPIKNGVKNGVVRSFHRNGVVSVECQYLKGNKNGFLKNYSNKGSLILLGNYCNGLECEEWLYYDSIGNIKLTEKYYMGKKILVK